MNNIWLHFHYGLNTCTNRYCLRHNQNPIIECEI